jgi:hypothetical protein
MSQYVDSILAILKDYESSKSTDCMHKILSTAIPTCIKKVRTRVRKICVELIKSGIIFESLENINDDVVNNIQIWQSAEVHEGLVGKAFADGYSHLKTVDEQMLQESDKVLITYYFRFVLEMEVPVSQLRNDLESVEELATLSYHVGMTPFN